MYLRTKFIRTNRHAGFTLIELLVTISIIAVLAAISLPIYRNVQSNTRRIKGISNLKQAGVAIMAYAGDHENIMPGPCGLGVMPVYSKNDTKNLGAYLAPYLGLPDPSLVTNSSKPQVVSILVSPGMVAWKSAMALGTNGIPHYIQSDVLKGGTSTGGTGTVRPFGATASNGGTDTPGIRLTRLGDFTHVTTGEAMTPTKAWLLTDVDQQCKDTQAITSNWFGLLPVNPVYGTKRVRVYADGHAEAAGLTEL